MIFAALKPTRCNSFPFCQKSMSILLPLACKKIVWFLLYFHSNVVWFWAFVGILNGKECMLFISITNLLLLLWHINCRQKIFSCTLFMPLDGKTCAFSHKFPFKCCLNSCLLSKPNDKECILILSLVKVCCSSGKLWANIIWLHTNFACRWQKIHMQFLTSFNSNIVWFRVFSSKQNDKECMWVIVRTPNPRNKFWAPRWSPDTVLLSLESLR